MRESADRLPDGGETVATRGREIVRQAERFERVDFSCSDDCRRLIAEELAEKKHETADNRRLGIAAKIAAAIAHLPYEPYDGDAAEHAIGLDAVAGRKGWRTARAIDDEREALVHIVDGREFLGELGKFAGERHSADVLRGDPRFSWREREAR